MTYKLSFDQIRLVDRVAIEQFGISGLVLMENAGRGAADLIAELTSEESDYVILCGTGNNGGDGLVIARHLHAREQPVTVIISGNREKLSHDCRVNLSILEKTRVTIQWCDECLPFDSEKSVPNEETFNRIANADVVIDALLGTGAKGAPRGSAALLIEAANKSLAKKFAIDVPSGLNVETGEPNNPTFLANMTITFVAEKPCFNLARSEKITGKVAVLPIGIPPEVIDAVVAESNV
ncbi:MAG: NAD(P)H-hydrate epimerase [Pirellula sp.]